MGVRACPGLRELGIDPLVPGRSRVPEGSARRSRCPSGAVVGRHGASFRIVPAVSLEPGLFARTVLEVGDGDTALAMGTSNVEVLSTPRLVALCEEASCAALAGTLPAGKTTVGVRVQFDHLAPVRVGSKVTAEAVLERVEGRRLTFTVSAVDASGLVGAGRITRVVVEMEAFLAKAR